MRYRLIKIGKCKIAHRAVVFTFMKMVDIFHMTVHIVTMNKIMNIFNEIKPKKYPEEK